ncbi:hypothetical protein BaRGS_00035125 [Batillaria attramentaria]|uniref:Uncharacterized protein n=1 Tax=Batillaria attramentaria TaxID=370345 RepID=A0ABD0JFE6_9CAEN
MFAREQQGRLLLQVARSIVRACNANGIHRQLPGKQTRATTRQTNGQSINAIKPVRCIIDSLSHRCQFLSQVWDKPSSLMFLYNRLLRRWQQKAVYNEFYCRDVFPFVLNCNLRYIFCHVISKKFPFHLTPPLSPPPPPLRP